MRYTLLMCRHGRPTFAAVHFDMELTCDEPYRRRTLERGETLMTMTPDFPVVWDDPRDAELTWTVDRIHTARPVTPLGAVMADVVTKGFARAFEEYSVPARFRQVVINGWLYGTLTPLDMSPADAERMMGEAQAKLGAAIATLGPLWDETYLPEIKRLLEPLAAFDLRGASLDELVAHWESVQATMNRLFEIHFLIIVPSYLAVSEFDELYIRLFQATDPHESYRLLQGIGNKTVDTSIALWELSRRARNLPEVRRVLTDSTDGDALDALERVEGGKGFVHELREYLSEYGQRGDAWDIAYPSWIEDPTPVLRTLREYLDAYSHPAVELQRTGAERERLVAAAREKLTDPADRAGFDFLLGAAEKGIVITEDHGFWIDFRGMHQVRMAVVEFGRRFADEGVIDEPQDVFFLHPAEITHTAVGLPALDRRELVAERRAALERARSIEPPPFVGAPPSEEPEEENPISRAMGKLFGGPPPAPSGDALRGHPGSAGVARGRARIISSIADADRLEPGDVLVAQATAPPWTPLFAIASAVVTDAGGILSHCAVVAREYQIPAVVGCGDATTRIRDGQTIEVDGDQGVVRVVG